MISKHESRDDEDISSDGSHSVNPIFTKACLSKHYESVYKTNTLESRRYNNAVMNWTRNKRIFD